MSFGRGRGQGRGNERGTGRSENRGGRNSPANAQGRGSNPNQNQGQGSSQQSRQHHAQGQRYEKSNVQCYYCKKYRHYANECRKKQHDMSDRPNANVTRENISQDNVFLACNMAETNSEDIWFLDSGCNKHMTGNIALFSALDQNVKSEVTLGTDSKISIMGKGEVKIFTKKGGKKTIADVYYVPGMRCNLLSIGQLVHKGYNVFFKNDVCTIMDIAPSKRCIAEVKMTRNRMFPLRIRAYLKNKEVIAEVTQEAFESVPKDENWLWHLRFGHLNFGGLNLLSRKGMVRGLPLIEKSDSLCESWILGKQHRESFPSGKSIRVKVPLEIVHSDLCGPMQTPPLAGSQYFLTFIDDFTRKTWVYFLKNNSEVFEKFRNFKALVENQSGLHIKVLRTDRGGEYISKEFLRFCRENGIHKQFKARYTPQQNGVAERKNRTIMDMARSMLKAKHSPNDYWAEAVNFAVYILNRFPTKAVMNRVPEEAWSGRKERVTHMKVFGCVAYAHIPDQLRRKLDSKGEKYIFIGYSEESKAYRDVQFIEEEAWDGSIEKTVNVKNCLSHDEDDEEMAEIHPQTKAPTQGQQATPLRRNESASPSTPQGGNSSASSSICTPNERGKKFRNLSDIYDEGMNSLFSLYCHVDDPIHFEDAIKDKKWIEVMDDEMNAIERNKTWDLVELPKCKEVIGVKWVYKTKCNAEGKIEIHKARLVVKGYKLQYGRDYEEFRTGCKNGNCYEKKGQEHKVCRLKKALYGLKQAPRAWYSRIDSYLLENGFDKCEGEPTSYIKEKDCKILIVVLYVDDVIFTCNDVCLIDNFKAVMKKEFEMTDMGLVRYFLGIEVDQNENGIFISQAKYVNEVLGRFNMQECKAEITPTVMGLKISKEDSSKDFDPSLYKSIVGSLMYLTATRPDIMFAVSLISRFMERPKEAYWQAAKRILRYVKGTKRFGILYTISECSYLIGYTDSDWVGSVDDRRSTYGYFFHMGSGAISWASKKQSIVALSTAEADFVASTAAACQAVWMRRMLRSLGQEQAKATVIFCDNSSAIAISKNSVFHKRTKHIDTRFHYIRELVSNGEIVLEHCRTQEQVADILTKPLDQKSFEFLRKCLGMTNNPAVEIKGEC
eukprot:PITA_25723